MAATVILKIASVAITYRRFFDFSEILCEEAEWHAVKGHMTKTANFKNPRWRTAAILKQRQGAGYDKSSNRCQSVLPRCQIGADT